MRPELRLLPNPAEPSDALDSPEMVAADTPPGLSLQQIVTIVRAYRKQSAIIAGTLILLCALAIKLLPKTYTATATLLVNSENQDPLAAPQFMNTAFANYVATQMELMQSPVVLLPVVDRLDLTHDRDFRSGNPTLTEEAIRDFAGRLLAKQVEVEAGRGGELLNISASAKYPDLSAKIANAVAEVYLEEERKRLSAPASERAERYSQELAELRNKVAAAQDKVTQFRMRNGMTDVNLSGADVETEALGTLERQLIDVQNQRRTLEAKQVGEQTTGDEALASDQVTKLKTQLGELRTQLAALDPTLGSHHPKVIALRSQLAETQAALNRAVDTLSQNTSTQLQRVRDLETRLTAAIAAQRTKVLTKHEVEGQGQKLQVELESAQAVYKRALDGYDQTLFASVNPSTNVSFISRATVPTQPSKPNKWKLLSFGAIGSLVIGLALPMVYELFFRRRLRCRDDFERAFGIPILAQFDATATSSRV